MTVIAALFVLAVVLAACFVSAWILVALLFLPGYAIGALALWTLRGRDKR